jgi:tocopherol cyclase
MFHPIKKLYRPEFFQGNRRLARPSRYFEGWYFKAAFDGDPFALIPGVSLTATDAHGFIQVIGGPAGSSRYYRFELEEFSYNRKNFEIFLGDNRFSLDRIEVDLDDVRVRLTLGNVVRWPSSFLSPGSMGWYSFMRFMECYHGVVLLDADINGTVNGKTRRGGRLYLEKDWGISFPKAWIWMQTNSFSTRASLTCSVARVPFLGREFTGFIIGLFAGGKLYSFTTYNGSRISEIEYDEGFIGITVRKGGMVLKIRARREAGAQLASPVQGEMIGRIEETLGSEITAYLSQDGRRLFADRGEHAGLEVVNPDQLRDEILDPGTR